MNKLLFAFVFAFAVYLSEAKSLGEPVVVVKRSALSQAELLLKLSSLLGKSNGVIAALEKEGKPLLAAGIKKVEELLKSLEEKVKNANPKTEIGKLALKGLDELIIKAEDKLEEELKKVSASSKPLIVAKRDVLSQAEMLLKLAELLSKSKLARDLLEKEGKPLLAAGIKKVEDLLHKLEEKVKNASPKTEIGKLALKGLDDLIIKAENKLEEELKKIEGSDKPVVVAKRDVVSQATLLLKLAELLSKSQLARDLLEKEGKPLLAAGIKKVEEVLHKLEEKVKNANPKTEIGKLALKGLDDLIIKAEDKLEEELKKIEGSDKPVHVAKRDLKSQEELLLKLAQLLSKSQLARDLLEKEGKPLLAAGIKKVEDLLHKLEEKVKNASPKTEIGKLALKGLDDLIIKAENKLEEELKKIEGSDKPVHVTKRDVLSQAEMLLKLAELLSKSKLARDLLEKEGKPLLAAGIKKVEDLLHKLEEKVKNASPKTEIGKLALKGLDDLIIKAEDKLEEELKKIEGSDKPVHVAKRDLKSQEELLLKLAQLLSKSQLARDLLEKEGKPLLAEGIKKLEDLLHSLETKVKNASPKTEIGKLALKGLDELIIKAEDKLEEELKKIEDSKTRSKRDVIKEELLKVGEEMESKVKQVIESLLAQGKSIEASELQALQTVVNALEKRLESIDPKTELGKVVLNSVESLLKKAETKLSEVLNRLSAHP